uniref:Uncharacterized protein n=1 Tax=Rhizophora mucronata TaxID=61149 RepID=A0A2P2NAX9_RHIMU
MLLNPAIKKRNSKSDLKGTEVCHLYQFNITSYPTNN